MKCPKCNSEIPAGVRFCEVCGTEVNAQAEEMSAPTVDAAVTEPQAAEASGEGAYEQQGTAPVYPENGETVVLTPDMMANQPQWQQFAQNQQEQAPQQEQQGQWQAPNGAPQQNQQGQWQAPNGAPQQNQQGQWQAPNGAPQQNQQGQWQAPNGAPQQGQWQAPPNGPQPGMGYQSAPKQKKPLNTKLIALIAAAALVVIIVAVVGVTLISNRKQVISLEDYITVTSSGYDGYGKVSVDFDYSTYSSDLLSKSKLKISSSSSDSYDLSSYLSEDYTKYYTVYYATDYSADKTSGLSNGDTVTITFTYDEETAKSIGIKYKSESMEYEVSDLEAVTEIDPFADITVNFTGTSPNAYAEVVNNSSDERVQDLYFSLDISSGIAIGDTVTVSIYTYDDDDYYAEYYGYTFTQTSKQFVCENVDYYATDASEVDEDILGQMKSQAEDVISAYFATESEYMTSSGLTYLGYYFLSNKGSSWGDENKIYLVYSAVVASTDGSFETSTVYLPIMFSNLIIYADGTGYVNLSDYDGILGDTSLEYGWWSSVDGYDSLSLLKNDLITSQKADYTDSYAGDLE
ncbi:MAG: zinc ribbon domain-containing protein [Clostridiales bacterium]|nr:zinc ribbon domain-containing protein [Clostridiales bacterium]